MTRDVWTLTKGVGRRGICKFFARPQADMDAAVCVAVDTDGRTLMHPSKVVNCA